MTNLPTDPEELAKFYIAMGSALTLTSVYDYITELQVFEVEKVFPIGSPEFHAVTNMMEILKRTIAQKQNKLAEKLNGMTE